MSKMHGGRRKRAGRKPIADKKRQINLYVVQSKIDQIGGDEKLKEYLYKCLDEYDAP